jgi:uncharacterized protein
VNDRDGVSRRHWTVAVLAWLLTAGLLGYIGIVGALYFNQRSLMYLPSAKRVAPAEANLPQAQEVVLDTADGEKLIAWYVPPRAEEPVVIFFSGNADTLAGRAGRFGDIADAGVGLLALSFRGYNGSTGHPTEDGLHRDAMAAYEFAAARYSPDRIVLWGYSLGTGVAVPLAAQRPIAKLVLEAPFTSAVDVAASIYPFVPVRLLMKDQFHSDEQIQKVKAPILIVHGERDQMIPISFGERLFALAPEPKRLVRFPLGRHEDLEDYGVVGVVLRFLAEEER